MRQGGSQCVTPGRQPARENHPPRNAASLPSWRSGNAPSGMPNSTSRPPTWQGRLGTWLARPASTRAVLALAAAGVLATLSGCVALMGVRP